MTGDIWMTTQWTLYFNQVCQQCYSYTSSSVSCLEFYLIKLAAVLKHYMF